MEMDTVQLIFLLKIVKINFFKFLINLAKKLFDNFNNKFKESLKGKCNTKNRLNCDRDSSAYSEYLRSYTELKNAHLLYDGLPCAKEMINGNGNGNYISISYMLLIFTLFSLLF